MSMKVVICKLIATIIALGAGAFVSVVIFAAASISTKVALTCIVIIIAFMVMAMGFIWGDKTREKIEE